MTDMTQISVSMLPAKDGDCLFVEAAGFRILVDGGRSQTGKTALPSFLRTLPARPSGPTIDLMILTHVDADHIAGLLSFMADLDGATIGEVWFNGLEHHKRAADIFIKTPAPDDSNKKPTENAGTLTVDQALDFNARVNALGIPWNKKLHSSAAMVLPDGELPHIALAPGLNLVLLGPPKDRLAKFFPEWEERVREFASQDVPEPNKVLSDTPAVAPTLENIHSLALDADISDRTRPNGASIVFVLEAGTKRLLFTADAHPGDVASGLERYAGKGRLAFDVVKVAHHGSAKNNTSVLIDGLQSTCWLFSTNGSGHGHPDSQAVARIVLTPGDDKLLAFNYCSEINSKWDKSELKSKFKYQTSYGDGKTALTVRL